jgi:hypothetical protein
VAWASRFRKNNWGVAGSFSVAAIAYYLMDHPDWELEEVSPYYQGSSSIKKCTRPHEIERSNIDTTNLLKLSPQNAFDSHNAYQLGRQSTSFEWKLDAKASTWGILPNGAIPEEIRRGNDPIDG